MPRPKVRTVRKPLMLSPEESGQLEVMAKAARMNESAFLRQLIALAWAIGSYAKTAPAEQPPAGAAPPTP